MLYWLLVIPVLAILILAHEAGHFAAARWMRVRILEFGIGYPPRMVKLGERNGVTYSLNWIPVGGFVQMAGEEDAGVEGGLAAKRPWQRIIVLAAGSLMNLLLTLLLFTGLALAPHKAPTWERVGVLGIVPGSPAEQASLQSTDILLAVNGRPVQDEEALLEIALNGGQETKLRVERQGEVLTLTVIPAVEPFYGIDHLGVDLYLPEHPEAVLGQVIPDMPAHQAGLREGDVVVSLNGHAVRNNLDFWETLTRQRESLRSLEFVVRRQGQLLTVAVQQPPPEADNQRLGIGWSAPKRVVRLALPAALLQGVRETGESVFLVPRILAAIFRGSVPVSELAGPIGMAQATAEVAQASHTEGIVRLVAMLSANLFVVNLLPLPALDGGRLAFVLLEWLRGGRRVPHRWEAWVHTLGMVVLLALVVLISVFDVLRLLSGR